MDSDQLKKMCNKFKLEYIKADDMEGEFICNTLLDCIDKADKYDKAIEKLERDKKQLGNKKQHISKNSNDYKDDGKYEYIQETLEEMRLD